MDLQQLLALPRVGVLEVEAHHGKVRVSMKFRGSEARPLLELSPEEADALARHLWSTGTEIQMKAARERAAAKLADADGLAVAPA